MSLDCRAPSGPTFSAILVQEADIVGGFFRVVAYEQRTIIRCVVARLGSDGNNRRFKAALERYQHFSGRSRNGAGENYTDAFHVDAGSG